MPIIDEFGNTERLIAENTIRLNKPEEFNDPFDLNIAPRLDIHDDDLNNYISSKMLMKSNYTEQELIKIRNQLNKYPLDTEFVQGISEGMLNGGIRTHGIYCFSKYWQIIKMWSHYADKHKGICVQFDFNEDSQLFKYLAQVEYEFEFPQVFINDDKNYNKFFQSKWLGWQEEFEIRIIKPHGGGEFIKLPEAEIAGIFFGIKSEKDKIQLVIDWLSKRVKKPKFFKAVAINGEYKIDRIPINWRQGLTSDDIVSKN